MIAIKVDGRYLDLPADVRIRIVMPSQVFAANFVATGYSYPIKLPKTSANQLAMRYYERVANTREYEDVLCSIELGGNHWRDAIIKFRGFKDDAYDVDLQVPERDEVRRLNALTVNDLQVEYDFTFPGAYDIDDLNDLLATRVGTAEETDFIWAPIRNTGIFGDREETFYNVLAADYPEYVPADEYVNYYDQDLSNEWLKYQLLLSPDRNMMEFVPLPYLCKVVDHLLAMVDLTVSGDVFRNEEVRTQVVLSNLLVSVGVGTDLSVAIPFSDYGPAYYPYARLAEMLPEISAIDLLVRICKRYNAVPLFRLGRQMDIRSRSDILNSNFYEDITEWAEPKQEMDVEMNGGITYIEQEEGTDSARLKPKFDPSKIIDTVRLPSALAGITAENGDLVRVEVTNSIWLYQFGDWEELADDLPSVSLGGGGSSEDVGVGFTRMWRGEDTNKSGREWLVPHVEQQLHDTFVDVHRLGPNRTEELRLLFYRGLREDSNGDTYPLVTNDIFDYNGNEIFGATMREALDTTRGIVHRWHETWNNVMRVARVVNKRIRIPAHRLRNFPWDRKFRIDGNQYLVRKIDVEFTPRGMSVPQVELVKLPTEMSGVRLPIVCAGRGHFTMYFDAATVSIDILATSTNGYLSYRLEDGIVTVATDSLFATIDADAVVPVCIFSSDDVGISDGDIQLLSIINTFKSLDITYLSELLSLEISDASQMEAPISLSTNFGLEALTILAYPYPTLSLSGPINLIGLQMPGSALTTMDVSGNPTITLLDLSGCALDDVDQLFIDLDANGAINGTVDVSGGTNAAPTGASSAARANLVTNGWTVTHN